MRNKTLWLHLIVHFRHSVHKRGRKHCGRHTLLDFHISNKYGNFTLWKYCQRSAKELLICKWNWIPHFNCKAYQFQWFNLLICHDKWLFKTLYISIIMQEILLSPSWIITSWKTCNNKTDKWLLCLPNMSVEIKTVSKTQNWQTRQKQPGIIFKDLMVNLYTFTLILWDHSPMNNVSFTYLPLWIDLAIGLMNFSSEIFPLKQLQNSH